MDQNEAEQVIEGLHGLLGEALEVLSEMVAQNCASPGQPHTAGDPYNYFSGFIGANADAIRLLGKHGLMETRDSGGRVIEGKFLKGNAPW